MQPVDTEPAKACLKALEVTSTREGSWPAGSPLHAVTDLLNHYNQGSSRALKRAAATGQEKTTSKDLKLKVRQEIMSIWKAPVEQDPALLGFLPSTHS